MGATAFVMASFLNVSYVTVAVAAIVPSVLYFFGLFVQIDACAARRHLHGLPRQELPTLGQVLREGWYFIAVFHCPGLDASGLAAGSSGPVLCHCIVADY